MFATEAGHVDAVGMLLDCGADALLQASLASPVPDTSPTPPRTSFTSSRIYLRISPRLLPSPTPHLPSSSPRQHRTRLEAPRCTTP